MQEPNDIVHTEKFRYGDTIYVASDFGIPVFYCFTGYIYRDYKINKIEAINIRSRDVCYLSPEAAKSVPLTRYVLFEKIKKHTWL